MKRKNERDDLLRDVFVEGSGIREDIVAECARVSRRCHRFRRAWGIGGAVVLAILAVLLLQFRRVPKKEIGPGAGAATSYGLVHTALFPAESIIKTSPGMIGQAVNDASRVEIVQSTSGNYRLIDDAELLTLAGPHPCALVQVAPHVEELVFVNAEDAKALLR